MPGTGRPNPADQPGRFMRGTRVDSTLRCWFVILTLSLVVFAVHVPVLSGFTVARFHERDPAAA